LGGWGNWSAEAGGAPPEAPGLYVHIPFCRSLCPYCDFTIARSDPGAFEGLVRALAREWELRGAGLQVRSVYLGGGTPTELPSEMLAGLLKLLTAGVSPLEVGLEANPESVTLDKLRAARAAGLTRVSLGVQSTDEALLKTLGRGHSAAQAREAFGHARQAGIPSINVDLMFGLPGQTPEAFDATLDQVLAWGPDHVSAYALELNPKVPLARRIASGRVPALGDAAAEDQYGALCRRLRESGFEHYEVSNFCLPGHRSAHNEGYWQDRAYLGLGPGAHSFDGRVRSWNVRPHRLYAERIRERGDATEGSERPTPEQRRLERVFLALRTSEGLALEALDPAAARAARAWAAGGDPSRVVCDEGRLRFTEAGFWYSQALTAELAAALPPVPAVGTGAKRPTEEAES
jgi:putative oxygen-independent coproporphyrinogen III oxidase